MPEEWVIQHTQPNRAERRRMSNSMQNEGRKNYRKAIRAGRRLEKNMDTSTLRAACIAAQKEQGQDSASVLIPSSGPSMSILKGGPIGTPSAQGFLLYKADEVLSFLNTVEEIFSDSF